MGKVDLHIYDKELLLQEQSERFKARMLLGDSFYYYLLYGASKDHLLAHAIAEPKSDSQLKFGSGFVAENLSSDKLTKLEDLKIDVFMAHRDFSLIPQKLFDESNKDIYIDNLKEGVILHRKVEFGKEHFSIVWFIPARFNDILGSKYVQHQNFHVSELMLRKAENLSSDFPSFAYAIQVGRSLFICVVKNRQIQAINAYEVRTREDLLYYILLNFQNFGLQAGQDSLFLSGVFKKDRKEMELMNSYFSPRVILLEFSPRDSEHETVPVESNSLFSLLQN